MYIERNCVSELRYLSDQNLGFLMLQSGHIFENYFRDFSSVNLTNYLFLK